MTQYSLSREAYFRWNTCVLTFDPNTGVRSAVPPLWHLVYYFCPRCYYSFKHLSCGKLNGHGYRFSMAVEPSPTLDIMLPISLHRQAGSWFIFMHKIGCVSSTAPPCASPTPVFRSKCFKPPTRFSHTKSYINVEIKFERVTVIHFPSFYPIFLFAPAFAINHHY